MKKYRSYLVATLYIVGMSAMLISNSSCASRCKQQHRYWSKHRAV